jgi:hypothetical protein
MRLLSKLEIRDIKKRYLQRPHQKTLCKKCEQYGGNVVFLVEDKKYTLSYLPTGAYTDFVESKHSHNTGTLHKGNNSRNMDKWNKFNHEEYKTHKNIDKKNK